MKRPRGLAFPLVFFLATAACDSAGGGAAAPDTACTDGVLFGRPVAATGLTDAQCQPRCSCSGTSWEAPSFAEADIDKLLAWDLLEPPALLTADPYAAALSPPESPPDEMCAVLPDAPGSRSYRLETYPSEGAARESGAIPTHFGACGLCSTLADLAVYMRYPDLTAPVRQCGLDNLGGPEESHIACLAALGFQPACAQIWYYNTIHTREACGGVCFAALGATYNQPDGSLNECLQCDEDESGPVFKAVAGRTRRNTGVASAICRPCSEARSIAHDYP